MDSTFWALFRPAVMLVEAKQGRYFDRDLILISDPHLLCTSVGSVVKAKRGWPLCNLILPPSFEIELVTRLFLSNPFKFCQHLMMH